MKLFGKHLIFIVSDRPINPDKLKALASGESHIHRTPRNRKKKDKGQAVLPMEGVNAAI
jgi:hypothetical protein